MTCFKCRKKGTLLVNVLKIRWQSTSRSKSSLQGQLLQHVEEDQETVSLRAQKEEEKRTQEALANQLKDKEVTCQEHES